MFKTGLTALVALFAVQSMAADYEIDAAHSSVAFKIRHMMVSKTTGKFEKFSANFSMEKGRLDSLKGEAKIDVNSINTGDSKRDDHLRGADFFDVKKFPEMTFKSKKVSGVNGSKAKLEGDLTLHGVTKPVVLALEFNGEGTDPWGNHKAGFSATTKLKRKDFGLVWNKTLETGGLLIGDDVEISLDIEAAAKK